MGKYINILDDLTINKIAAGEVVERPSSVVKELLENAIDSGATQVVIEIEDGGKKSIKIIDNGSGILSSEVEKCFLRHATSKIKNIDDLYNLYSLGFRGEALASISSVAKIELITKTREEVLGTKVVLDGGKIIKKEPVGCKDGSTIIISDLFYNTPVRKKFLKSTHAETMNISDLVNKLVIGNPNVRIKYINNSKLMLNSPGDNKLISAIRSIYGKEITENLIEINHQDDRLKVTGYIGNNNVYRSNKNLQHVYINKRYVRSKIILEAINESYKGIIPINKFAVCFLNIDIDPHQIDVNIHPTKLEVKFEDEKDIYIAIRDIIKNKLLNISLIGKYKVDHRSLSNTELPKLNLQMSTEQNEDTKLNNAKVNNAGIDSNQINNAQISNSQDIVTNKIGISSGTENSYQNKDINNFDKIKEVEHLYTETNEREDLGSFKLFKEALDESIKSKEDQKQNVLQNNAVQDNILQNNIVQNDILQDNIVQNNTVQNEVINKVENTLQSEIINKENQIDKSQVVQECLDIIKDNSQKTSFRASDYRVIGTILNTYVVLEKGESMYLLDQHAAHEKVLYEEYMTKFKNKSINIQMLLDPVVIELSTVDMLNVEKNLDLFIKFGFEIELFGNNHIMLRGVPNIFGISQSEKFIFQIIDNIGNLESSYDLKLDKIASMSCRAAIKAHDKININEIKSLLYKMEQCENPYTCPHGRPSIVEISKKEIEKMFKRIM